MGDDLTSDDREYLLRANSDWPWVLVPLMGMVFVLGVGRMPSGDGTGALVLRMEPASGLHPTGFDPTFAGERP